MKTSFYEDNGGGIHAIVTDDEDNVTNVLTGFHMDAAAWDLSDLIASAKKGFPCADEYNPDEFSGLSMDEAAREIADMDDLVAEFSDDEEMIYSSNMGYAGKELFHIKEETKMNNYDLIMALEAEFKDRPWNEIPSSRIEEIDWLGYGWPTIDRYGEYIGSCLGAAEMGDASARTTIVTDPNGIDWMLLDYPNSADDHLPLPDGFRVSPDND